MVAAALQKLLPFGIFIVLLSCGFQVEIMRSKISISVATAKMSAHSRFWFFGESYVLLGIQVLGTHVSPFV